MDPRLHGSIPTEQFNPYLDYHYAYQQQQQQQQPQPALMPSSIAAGRGGSMPPVPPPTSRSLPSLSSGMGFYTLESLERSAMAPSASQPHILAPEGSVMMGGPYLQQGPDIVSNAVYPLMPHHQIMQHSGIASHDGSQLARNHGLSNVYAPPQLHFPGFNPAPQSAATSMHLVPAYGWNAELEREQGRGGAQAWVDLDRSSRPALKPWFKKKFKKDKPAMASKVAPGKLAKTVEVAPGKLATTVKVAPVAGKTNQQDRGPGWCSLCQIDCTTDAILKQHLVGKRHKKQLVKQTHAPEGTIQAALSDQPIQEVKEVVVGKRQRKRLQKQKNVLEGTMQASGCEQPIKEVKEADVLEQMWIEVSMMSKGSKPVIAPGKQGENVGTAGVVAIDMMTGRGKKRSRGEKERDDALQKDISNSAALDVPDAAAVGEIAGTKETEETRCELCNVECNSRASLEIHFMGKKHATSLRKLLTKDEIACAYSGVEGVPVTVEGETVC